MKKTIALLIASAIVLSACRMAPMAGENDPLPTGYKIVPEGYVSVSCVTHQTGYVHSFYIEEPGYNGVLGGRMVGGTNCGGLIAAGYALPETWYPGMKVKVRWKPNGREWVEKTTNIMRYEKGGDIYVHFFLGDQVRVVAANSGPTSPVHPIPRDAVIPPPEEQ